MKPESKYVLPGLAFLLLVTIFIYYRSLDNGFIPAWDDGTYILNNPGVKWLPGQSFGAVLKKSFSSFANGHYHPLTMVSYSIEYRLAGTAPWLYHFTNLLLHLLNVLLVFVFIRMLSRSSMAAFITALLFAVHPMHVESVAWISDRKDLLCALFYLSALCTYCLFLDKRSGLLYFLTFLLFLLALFSKAMAVTFPLVVFAIDYFKDRRMNRKMLLEKIPFLLLSLVFGYVSVLAQKANDALGDPHTFYLAERIMFASYALLMYLYRLFAFFDLSAYYNYPLPQKGLPLLFYISPVLVLLFAVGVYRIKSFRKEIRFGFLFFLITIAPVLQLLPAGNVLMADRYTYLPYVGLFFIAGTIFGGPAKEAFRKSIRRVAWPVLFLYCGLCSYVAFERTKVWHDSLTFWNDTVEKSPDAPLPFDNRGVLFIERKEFDKALSDINRAIELKPDFIEAYYNRGIAYTALGKYWEAVGDYSFVLFHRPRDAEKAFCNRGNAYMFMGNYAKAAEDYTSALRFNTGYAQAWYNRGVVFYTLKNYPEAIKDYNEALRLDPEFIQAYYLRALSLYELEAYYEAMRDLSVVQQAGFPVDPGFAAALQAKL